MEQVQLWLEYAYKDLMAAKGLMNMGLYDISCNHCQQCLEKAFKAMIVKSGAAPDRSHNLILLARNAGVYGELNAEQRDICAQLSATYTSMRYPDPESIGEVSEEFCIHVCNETEAMFGWIDSMVSK